MNLLGINIVESPLLGAEPVLRIRKHVPCTERVRNEVNDYLLRTFGTRHYAYMFDPSSVGLMGERFIAMHPSAMAALRMKGHP